MFAGNCEDCANYNKCFPIPVESEGLMAMVSEQFGAIRIRNLCNFHDKKFWVAKD